MSKCRLGSPDGQMAMAIEKPEEWLEWSGRVVSDDGAGAANARTENPVWLVADCLGRR